jgi:hypothetical protein
LDSAAQLAGDDYILGGSVVAGTNGKLDSAAQLAGDDYISGGTFNIGPNGIFDSASNLKVDDLISGGSVMPGVNGRLDSAAQLAGDDFISGGRVMPGLNGILQTTAVTDDLIVGGVITVGPNGILNSTPAGDDFLVSASGRAIGRIEATHDIYANVLIEASRGGIGEITASNDLGAKGSTETIEIKARTAIDTIYAGHNLGRPEVPIVLDVMGSGPGDVITLPMIQGNIEGTWLETNGVGVVGGIIAGSGDIYMNINTGGSIGAIQANVGKVVGEYHATGNLASVYGSRGIDGEFIAELGSIDFVFAATGGINGEFFAGGDIDMVQLGKGNITADFTAGGEIGSIGVVRGNITSDITGSDGIGSVVATFGNVSGSIYSGGKIGAIDEDQYAPKGDIDISLKLVKGDTSYISALDTTFALSDTTSTAHPYVYIRTNDQFTGIGTIQIKGSTSTTSFAITTDGGLFELDKFLVTGNFGSLTDAAGGGADASIDTVKISGSVSGSFAVDGVIGTISVGGLGVSGSIGTSVLSGSPFTFTVSGITDTVSVVGGNWYVTVEDVSVISAELIQLFASQLTFTTTSSVDDLSADLADRDLELTIGGDILGAIAIHTGDLNLDVSESILQGASVVVTDGSILSLIVGGNMAGLVKADVWADEMIFDIGGNMSGIIDVLGNLILHIGGNLSGSLSVGNGTIALDINGNILHGAVITGTVTDIDIGGTINPSLATTYHLNTNPDDDPVTPGDQDLYPDHITLPSGKTISVVGSSTSLDAYLNVAFDRIVLDTKIVGKGSLAFESTGTLLGEIEVAFGSKVSVKNIYVEGDMGGFINTNAKAKVANITAKGDIGRVIGYGAVQKIQAGGSIGEIRSLWDSIKNISAKEDIDKIMASSTVSNINAGGRISEILAGKSIKTVIAHEIGIINGGDCGSISNITVLGDIDLIVGKEASKVYAGGKLHVSVANKASKITSGVPIEISGTFPGGLVEVGVGYSKISPNIEVIVRPPTV